MAPDISAFLGKMHFDEVYMKQASTNILFHSYTGSKALNNEVVSIMTLKIFLHEIHSSDDLSDLWVNLYLSLHSQIQ